MNAEESGKIARLTTNAVNHPSDATMEKILDLISDAEKESTAIRETGEQIIKDFRSRAAVLSDQVNAHFEMCQRANRALQEIRTQVFGVEEEVSVPRVDTLDKLNRVATAAVVNAMLDKGTRRED